jgi:hypothetical protein
MQQLQLQLEQLVQPQTQEVLEHQLQQEVLVQQ